MSRIQTTCPRCHQPVVAEVQQLFDMNTDPTAKQKLLGRATNVTHCQSCGYEGLIATPIVYHDPEKELLLTFFPPDMGLPVNEQEKQIGPLITQVVNALPAEKRKGYLFQPQTMLTYQTLIDRILEADGITKEMMEAQQKRVNLLQRLITTPESADRIKIIQEEEPLVDGNLFTILTTLVESSINQGDDKSAQMLADLQKELLENTAFGRELMVQNQEAQKAIKALQDASKEGLTREKLLDILTEIQSESALATVVSLTRNGMDYQFFQTLTERIDKETDAKKQQLTVLRERLLKITREIDLQMKQQVENAEKLLNTILEDPDLEAAINKHLPELDEFFSQALRSEFDRANQAGDLARIDKIQKISSILEKMSTPPPEVELIQKLLDAPDETAQRQVLEENSALVTDELLQAMNSIINEGQARSQNPELVQALESAYKLALRFNMEKNLHS